MWIRITILALPMILGGCTNEITDRMDDFFSPAPLPVYDNVTYGPGYAPAYPPWPPQPDEPLVGNRQ